MSFQKYSSLENHTNSKFIAKVFEYLDLNGLRDTLFVAREKIHGTNFSVIITKDSIAPAKRTGPITETERFFGYEDLMARYRPNFEHAQSQTNFGPWNTIQIFGEYAGGNIQKEVDYGDKDFYVFDILADGQYLDDLAVTAFCRLVGLPMAPMIKTGTLEELLKLPVEFESVVQTYMKHFDEYGCMANALLYNQLPPTDNVAEGLVIKPVEAMFLPNGSRIAIKYKTDEFKEKGRAKAPKIPVPLSDSDQKVLFDFSQFVTHARVRNVCSHIGEITAKQFGQVMGLTMRDILEEAGREGYTIDIAESPSKVKAELQKMVTLNIREIWQDIIN